MMLSYPSATLAVVFASCGCEGWPSGCYWCLKKRAGLFANPWSMGDGLSQYQRQLVGITNGHKTSERGGWVPATTWIARHSTHELEDRDEASLRGIQWLIGSGDQRAELSV
jgi:hypothetical protein